MLNKLLKYDLKYMLKNMIVFYILTIFFAITTRILFSMEQSIIINIIGQISVGCMFAMIVNTLINTIMRSWVRFSNSIYKDESYLTHTLPVTKNDIYNSKFIQTLIFFIFGFVIIVLGIFIAYYTEDRWLLLTDFINNTITGLGFDVSLFIVSIIILLFLEIFNAIQCGFLGIILGNQKNNNKTLFSVLFGFITYLLSQTVVIILVFLIGIFNSDVMALFSTNNTLLDANSFKILALLAIIFYTLIIIVMNIICKKELNKGVNIE